MAGSSQYLALFLLSAACYLAETRSATDHDDLPDEHCPNEALDDSVVLLQDSMVLLQAKIKRDDTSSSTMSTKTIVSGSALGCMEQRWALHAAGKLPRAWPDACFQSVIKSNSLPDADTISKWMQASCTCFNPIAPPPPPADNFIYKEVVTYENLQESTFIYNTALNENYARTKAIDGLLDVLLAETPNAQVVNLGAGFDGRFYSLPSLKNASKLFELDQEDTQTLKRALVRQCGLKAEAAAGVNYFTLALSKENVYENLFKDPSFDAKQPTFFISEAFFQYLPPTAVHSSLKAIADVLRQNPASRAIVQSYVSGVNAPPVGLDVDGDAVLFRFPADPAARKAFYADKNLRSAPTKAEQAVLDGFQQYMARVNEQEYMDVLASPSSA